MAGCSSAVSIRGKRHQELLLAGLTIMVVLTQVLMVASMYVPNGDMMGNSNLMRRADSDEDDEMDSRASAPYQDQGETSSPANDGFDDNEQEGSYEETPRDEEGQADLEKFFDDHLGASERDGMDKENLPTNLVAFVVGAPDARVHRLGTSHGFNNLAGQQVVANQPVFAYDGLASQPAISYSGQSPMMSPNNVETSYIRLPNKRLIITRQITRGPIYKGGLDDNFPPIPPHILQLQGRNFDQDQDKDAQPQQQQQPEQKQVSSNNDEELNAKGSDIVRTEDDDLDPVYVTTATNKPFKIDALGGFDPEEDFQDASRDLEEPPKQKSASGNQKRSSDEDYQQTRDISFNDPEPDNLFNDASETDEVIFGSDPYQTDLEAEMSGQTATGKPDNGADATASTTTDETEDSPANERPSLKPANDDDSESNWVNDGVEDMDVPSQSYQDAVLEKAARNEALRRAAEEPTEDDARQQEKEQEQEQQQEQPQPQQPETDQGEGENQRMPNADYLKNDLSGMDDVDDALR